MNDAGQAAKAWEDIRESMRDEFGEASFQSWIQVLNLESVDDGCVRITAPNRFICDRVSGRFGDRLRELWCAHDTSINHVTIDVSRPCEMGSGPAPIPAANDTAPSPAEEPSASVSPKRRLTLSSADPEDVARHGEAGDLEPRYKFDSFVVGKSNELANAAARRIAEADTPQASFNPLFLYGGVGLGKTHLMHAIAWEARARHPEKRILYLTAEKFMHRFVSALRYKDTFAFKQEFRSVELLLVDDFQFIGGKDYTQEEFFHTFNTLIDQNRQIVISADRSPSDLKDVEERIKSRLNWGLVVDIGPTDYELRLGILQSKAEEAAQAHPGLRFGPHVLEFIANKIASNARVLEGALNRLVAHATLVGREVTVDMAHDTLTDLVRAYDRRLTIEEIQRKVAEHYNVKLSDMLSPRRARSIARPRQIAMYLCKELTDKSLPEIGRKFGGRDHTTIIHGVKKVTLLCAEDQNIREDVTLLRRTLES